MAALGMLLKKLIKEIEGMIDRGDCDGITEDQLEEISILVHQPECVGREDAARMLGVSLNRFYELRDAGIVPMPKKIRGRKEKMYSVYDIKKVKVPE